MLLSSLIIERYSFSGIAINRPHYRGNNKMAVHKLGVLLFTNCFLRIYASYHWIVTESGRIQSQVENSGFPLARQDDLLALLEQEKRVNAVKILYKELISLKKSIDHQWSEIEGEGELEKRLYSSDIDCVLGKIPLSQHNLNTEFLDYGQGSRPKMKDNIQSAEPDCTMYSELDFSMRTFPHLETLNKRGNFNLTVTPVPSKNNLNFNIDAMLKHNSSDWTAYNAASFYWRTMGNGSNAVECARRALYFSPRNKRYIVLLNLGTLLQELDSLGEAAIILHSAVDHDPIQEISHLALGNVYAALGDYNRSLVCYENVLSLDPGNIRASQLKHALLCHKKLESGLLEIHSSLQKILQDHQKHYTMHEEWLILQNQVNWERDSKIKELFSLTQPVYLNLEMLLQNVEHQAKTLNEKVIKRVQGRKSESEGKGVQGNKLKSESGGERSQQCQQCRQSQSPKEDLEEEETELVNLDPSDKMGSFVSFVKSSYEKEMSLMDFKRKISQQLNYLKELNGETYLSADRSLLLSNVDACLKDTNNVKKLN